jgi:glycosyltransferase involved in cell wall biosynthesis
LRRSHTAGYVMTLHDYSLLCSTKRLMRRGEPCSGPGVAKCAACAGEHYGRLSGPPIAALTALSGQLQRRAVDLFLPISHAVAARCRLAEGIVPFEVVPNFLPDEPRVAPPEDPALAQLPDRDFILFAGDLSLDKGIGTLVQAHAQMASDVPLVLIGRAVDGTPVPSQPGISVLGALPHESVLAAWRKCAVGVVPSRWAEPFGLVALEAMAAGVPLVASRIGGLLDFVSDGESGILVDPGDPAALAAALDRLIGDPKLRARFGAGGAQRALEYTASAVMPRVEAAYGRALGRETLSVV